MKQLRILLIPTETAQGIVTKFIFDSSTLQNLKYKMYVRKTILFHLLQLDRS